jgi:P-type E1-E2 ATPase
MFLIALATFLCMIPQLLATDSLKDVVVSFLDLVAITVPAALPVSMALGIIYSIQKLKEKSIFCIEQQKVIAGGDVSFCCFDKTGTLTEDYMDF